MTEAEYLQLGRQLSREAAIADNLHSYFEQQAPRLHQSCALFGLHHRPLGAVLDIGPFFAYTPFALRRQASSYTVLEGDDPAAYPLKPLYEKHHVTAEFVDLFEMFGPTHAAPHRLPYPDNSFDTVLCWETMEHFNFNPAKFVREMLRVLKPGGRACITVPNRASFQNLGALAFGWRERDHIEAFFHFEDYICNGKKAFYGFHWHEYTPSELPLLFERAGFSTARRGTIVAFQAHQAATLKRRIARSGMRFLAGLLPRFGTHVTLEAVKPDRPAQKPDAAARA